MKNPIEELEERVRLRFPQAEAALDRPRNPEASWWLDVAMDDRAVTVEWRPALGFGVTARPDVVYGEGSDETYDSADDAFARVKQLILSGARTSPPREMTLAELRRYREVSQVELAHRLDIKQASVSKMERRDDLLLGTLKTMVAAMGGVLEIQARFPDEVVRIQFEPAQERKAS